MMSFLSLVTADVMTSSWVHVTPDEPIANARRLFSHSRVQRSAGRARRADVRLGYPA